MSLWRHWRFADYCPSSHPTCLQKFNLETHRARWKGLLKDVICDMNRYWFWKKEFKRNVMVLINPEKMDEIILNLKITAFLVWDGAFSQWFQYQKTHLLLSLVFFYVFVETDIFWAFLWKMRCVVPGCNNPESKRAGIKVQLFPFPNDPMIRNRWILSLKFHPDWRPNGNNSRVCADHFTKVSLL